MRALDPLPCGFAASEPWPSGHRVECRPVRSAEALVFQERFGFWALNPYSGCEFACAHCPVREQAPFRDADFRLFERDIHARANAAEAVARMLREGGAARGPVVLGTACEPWQPVERQAQVTRSALEVLARWGEGVELRAQTRSTLVPRDIDLLTAIARRGAARVEFPIGTVDHKLSRLLEPLAPTADRRFIAMEALARGGVQVGLLAAPLVRGLNDSLPALERLLRRAKAAGASFASAAPLVVSEQGRGRLVRFVAQHNPELATRYDRLFARSAEREPGFAEELQARFLDACEKVGLKAVRPTPQPTIPERPVTSPQQLSLF